MRLIMAADADGLIISERDIRANLPAIAVARAAHASAGVMPPVSPMTCRLVTEQVIGIHDSGDFAAWVAVCNDQASSQYMRRSGTWQLWDASAGAHTASAPQGSNQYTDHDGCTLLEEC